MNLSCRVLVILLVLASLLAACSAAAPSAPSAASGNATGQSAKAGGQDRWDKAVSEGKKEGQVVIYTIAGPTVRELLTKSFLEKYGIEAQFVAGQTAEVANKLIIEHERGLKYADAVIVGGGTMLSVIKPKGAIGPLEPFLILPENTDPKLWFGGVLFHDKDKTGIGFLSYYTRPIFRNTDMVKAEDITSYADLLKPQWKGKIMMEDPTITGSTISWTAFMERAWGMDKVKDYLRQLVKQEPVLNRDPRLIYESVAKGKYPVGISARPDTMVEFRGMGAPVASVKVNELSKMTPSTGVISVASDPAHPNATTVFVNWLLSKEGQAVASKAWGLPTARTDMPSVAFDRSFFPEPDEKYFVQDEEDYLMQGTMLDVNKEIFSPLMR